MSSRKSSGSRKSNNTSGSGSERKKKKSAAVGKGIAKNFDSDLKALLKRVEPGVSFVDAKNENALGLVNDVLVAVIKRVARQKIVAKSLRNGEEQVTQHDVEVALEKIAPEDAAVLVDNGIMEGKDWLHERDLLGKIGSGSLSRVRVAHMLEEFSGRNNVSEDAIIVLTGALEYIVASWLQLAVNGMKRGSGRKKIGVRDLMEVVRLPYDSEGIFLRSFIEDDGSNEYVRE